VYVNADGTHDGTRKFTVKAIEDSDMLTLSKDDMRVLIEEFEEYMSEVFENSEWKLRQVMKLRDQKEGEMLRQMIRRR